MLAHAREEARDVLALVEMQERVEGARDELEPALELGAAHVAVSQRDARPHVGGLTRQALTQVGEHRLGQVDAGDLDASASRREQDAAVAAPVLEHRAAGLLGALDVK